MGGTRGGVTGCDDERQAQENESGYEPHGGMPCAEMAEMLLGVRVWGSEGWLLGVRVWGFEGRLFWNGESVCCAGLCCVVLCCV